MPHCVQYRTPFYTRNMVELNIYVCKYTGGCPYIQKCSAVYHSTHNIWKLRILRNFIIAAAEALPDQILPPKRKDFYEYQFSRIQLHGRIWDQRRSLYVQTEKGIFIVADGLGGHSGGKRTSLTAIEYFKEHFSGNYTNECISHLPEGANKEVMGKGTAARLPLPPHLSQLFLIKGKGKHCKTAQTNETGTGAWKKRNIMI